MLSQLTAHPSERAEDAETILPPQMALLAPQAGSPLPGARGRGGVRADARFWGKRRTPKT